MNRLSVIIPYHSTPAELESSLLSLFENRPENCEICVVLNQSYENIYELGEEEVHFLDAVQQITAENRLVSNSMRLGLAACDSTYVYMMPAGVQFHSEWLGALEIMDQSEDLGAFFLDVNLTLGGFFRKPLLESLLQNSEISGVGVESDAECLTNLVAHMQAANLPCGLAEFEIIEEPEVDSEVEIESEVETDSNEKMESDFNLAVDSQFRSGVNCEIEPNVATGQKMEHQQGIKTEPASAPFSSTDRPEGPGLWTRFCARFRGFFK